LELVALAVYIPTYRLQPKVQHHLLEVLHPQLVADTAAAILAL
jgi:hypothetical protein